MERMDDDEVRIRGIIVYKTFKHESSMSSSVLTFSVRVCCNCQGGHGVGISITRLFVSSFHPTSIFILHNIQSSKPLCVLCPAVQGLARKVLE